MSKLISGLLFSLISVTCIFSCKKDSPPFLKRNTDQLFFGYNESSGHFTIRTTCQWSIDIPEAFSWIKVSPQQGTGDGTTYQEIQVTCMNNPGEARQGVIYLKGGGQVDVPVKIDQENGVFEWLHYGNGSFLRLQDRLIVNAPSAASITIPYTKATGKEQVTVQVSFAGKGAEGLKAATGPLSLEAGDGLLQIPVAGTPTTQGELTMTVKVDGKDFGTLTTIAGVGQTLIDQQFSKFLWGGDCIANKAGITTTMPTASMTLTDETAACAVGTNGANGSGVTSTIRTSNPGFYKEIGMENWTGVRNYMRPGYIQLGAASATADEYGSLITPPLNLPQGTFDLLVQFKLAVYIQPAPQQIVAGLIPRNTEGVKISNYNTITSKVQVPVNIPALKWVDYTCVIKNATNASGLVITLPEELNQGGAVQAGRIYVDALNISY